MRDAYDDINGGLGFDDSSYEDYRVRSRSLKELEKDVTVTDLCDQDTLECRRLRRKPIWDK